MKLFFSFALIFAFMPSKVQSQESLQKLYPVDFSQVNITYPFWSGRMHAVATNTLNACMLSPKIKTNRIQLFEKAAAHSG